MISDKIKIEIGIKNSSINGDTPIDLIIKNISSENLVLSCLPRLEIQGSIIGWSELNLLPHIAQPPFDSNPISISLSPQQNLYSKIILNKLFYSENTGSSSPSLTWRDFLKSISEVRSDFEISLICEFIDSSGQTEDVPSNVIKSKLDLDSENHHDVILENLDDILLTVDDLSNRLEDIENHVNPNP